MELFLESDHLCGGEFTLPQCQQRGTRHYTCQMIKSVHECEFRLQPFHKWGN